MSVSLDDFRNRVRATPQAQGRINELKGLAQEAPRMAALTGSAEWDYFLRFVEAQIKLAEREAEVKRGQAATLILVDEDKAKAAALAYTILQSRAETLREVILLPKWLIEQGGKAADLVAAIEAGEAPPVVA